MVKWEKWNAIGTLSMAALTLLLWHSSVTQSRQSLHATQRAWIVFAGVSEPIAADGLFKVVLKNKGLTPALKVRSSIHAERLLASPPTCPSSDGPTSVVGAEMRRNLGAKLEVTGLPGPVGRIHVYGTVTYFDVFDEEHFTQFCWIYEPSAVNSFVPCDNCNNAGDSLAWF